VLFNSEFSDISAFISEVTANLLGVSIATLIFSVVDARSMVFAILLPSESISVAPPKLSLESDCLKWEGGITNRLDFFFQP